MALQHSTMMAISCYMDWAAQYKAWLLINLAPKCVVFLFLFFSHGACRLAAKHVYQSLHAKVGGWTA